MRKRLFNILSLFVIVMFVMSTVMTSSAAASPAKETVQVEGTVTALYPEEGYFEVTLEDATVVKVTVGEDFDWTSIAEGDTVTVTGTIDEEGNLVSETVETGTGEPEPCAATGDDDDDDGTAGDDDDDSKVGTEDEGTTGDDDDGTTGDDDDDCVETGDDDDDDDTEPCVPAGDDDDDDGTTGDDDDSTTGDDDDSTTGDDDDGTTGDDDDGTTGDDDDDCGDDDDDDTEPVGKKHLKAAMCTGKMEHPMVARLAERYDADPDEILAMFCEGHFGFGQIALALQTEKLTGKPAADVLAARKGGQGWGKIWKEAGLKGGGKPDKTAKADKADKADKGNGKDKDKTNGKPDGKGNGKDKDKNTGKPEDKGGGKPEGKGKDKTK